jgi:hypothetical protein
VACVGERDLGILCGSGPCAERYERERDGGAANECGGQTHGGGPETGYVMGEPALRRYRVNASVVVMELRYDVAYLSASIGETRVARLAGRKQAAIVTIPSSTGTTANVVGSLADTPNRRLDISRVTTIDAPSPTMVPVAVRMRPGRNARPRISLGFAPKASRKCRTPARVA